MRPLRTLAGVFLTTAALCAAQIDAPSQIQTGTVTFYSPSLTVGRGVKEPFLPVAHVPYKGWLFDGDHPMAKVSTGQFATFHLAAGTHKLTVPWRHKKPSKTALNLTVDPGAHYCVRLWAKYFSSVVVPVGWIDSQIDQVDCSLAHKDAGKVKPISQKSVEELARGQWDSSSAFPTE